MEDIPNADNKDIGDLRQVIIQQNEEIQHLKKQIDDLQHYILDSDTSNNAEIASPTSKKAMEKLELKVKLLTDELERGKSKYSKLELKQRLEFQQKISSTKEIVDAEIVDYKNTISKLQSKVYRLQDELSETQSMKQSFGSLPSPREGLSGNSTTLLDDCRQDKEIDTGFIHNTVAKTKGNDTHSEKLSISQTPRTQSIFFYGFGMRKQLSYLGKWLPRLVLVDNKGLDIYTYKKKAEEELALLQDELMNLSIDNRRKLLLSQDLTLSRSIPISIITKIEAIGNDRILINFALFKSFMVLKLSSLELRDLLIESIKALQI